MRNKTLLNLVFRFFKILQARNFIVNFHSAYKQQRSAAASLLLITVVLLGPNAKPEARLQSNRTAQIETAATVKINTQKP